MSMLSNRGQALALFLAGYQAQPFSWGAHSCVHFAAAWVQACEGINPLPTLPANASEHTALRELRRHGATLADAVTSRLGRQPMAPAQAWVGDLVACPTLDGGVGQALGLCAGRTAVYLDEHGAFVHQPMSSALHAWRVGGAA